MTTHPTYTLPGADSGTEFQVDPAPRRARDGAPAHCHDVSKWDRMLFDARVATGGALDRAVGEVGEAIEAGANAARAAAASKAAAEGKPALAAPSARAEARRATTDATTFVSEVMSRLYGDPAKLDTPAADAPAWAPALHEALDGLQEFADLRAAVAGDPDFAALGAANMAHELAPRLAKVVEQVEQDAQADGEPSDGPGAADRARAALRAACGKAAQQVAEDKEALAGLAPGAEAAPATREHADPARMRLAERLGNDKNLRAILRMAGRLTRIHDRKARERRDPSARSEVVDMERGADLARALPAGLARLRHPTLRLLALKDIAERTMPQYRLEGHEKQGRGPMVVLLDCSGSMSGRPHQWARAVGIACLGVGAREKRPVTVVDFDTRPLAARHLTATGEALSVDPRTGATARLGGGKIIDAALDVASYGVHGGTDFGAVLRLALDGLPAGVRDDRADLVFVTDGCAECDDQTLAALADSKARGLRVTGLILNGGTASPAVAAICDTIVDLDKLAGNAREEGVASVLPG